MMKVLVLLTCLISLVYCNCNCNLDGTTGSLYTCSEVIRFNFLVKVFVRFRMRRVFSKYSTVIFQENPAGCNCRPNVLQESSCDLCYPQFYNLSTVNVFGCERKLSKAIVNCEYVLLPLTKANSIFILLRLLV